MFCAASGEMQASRLLSSTGLNIFYNSRINSVTTFILLRIEHALEPAINRIFSKINDIVTIEARGGVLLMYVCFRTNGAAPRI